MNNRNIALVLLSVIIGAAIVGSLIFVVQSTVKADPTASVASNSETNLSSVNASDLGFGGFVHGPMAFGMAPRFGMGFREIGRGFDRFGAIQVSSDFTTNVTNIVKSDSDVQNLLNQGYNITSIRPVISTIIDGNGNVVTKASTANVLLIGNNGSRSFVEVDLTQAKITKIVTLTVTEIDK